MPNPTLIQLEVGTFKGFAESGLEFTADIISPYHTEYRPRIGEFIVVTLSPESAILGRITRFFPMGVLSSLEGDEYLAEMRRRNREVPEDLKETRLRYTVNVKLLGGLEAREGAITYRASIRQLPHLGARVGTLTEEAMRFVCSLGKGEEHSVEIGHYVLGDTVFNGDEGTPALPVLFDLDHLVARRTYVFARAGYGKSNLIKLLLSRLYQLEQPGGTLIFDPEGEYAFRDKKGRPGLADVPDLAAKLVVYTNRHLGPPYSRWVVGDVRLNLTDLSAAEVVNQCVAQGKQDLVFANVLRGLDPDEWRDLIALLATDRYRADENTITAITGVQHDQAAVLGAIKNNLTPIVTALHSADSDLARAIRGHLAAGSIVVVDISLLSTTNGYRVAGLLLDELFRRNQENFIAGSQGDVIPIIAVLEEAQSILPKGVSESSSFVTWVKEGRKYQLGAILVTQQPGSIAPEFLSQGDNFFAFHLLSVGDLKALQSHNAHYSDDVLGSILNEPIKGNAYMWSAPDQPFVLPVRIGNFEKWADELPKDEEGVLAKAETPAEKSRRETPHRKERLVDAVKRAVEEAPNVALNTVAAINGSPAPATLAIRDWNLMFTIGELVAEDEELRAEFCRVMGDGKNYVQEQHCVDALEKLGLWVGKARDDKGSKYFLIDGQRVPKKRKESGLQLRAQASSTSQR